MLTLPETLEREHMALRDDVTFGVAALVDNALQTTNLRQDDEENPNLLAMLAVLGISAAAVINEDALRRRLRVFARRLGEQKRRELATLLGKRIPVPTPDLLDEWVDSQTLAITTSVDQWLAAASVEVKAKTRGEARSARAILAEGARKFGARARAAASAAVLALSGELVREGAQSVGSTHYRWVSKDDHVVRDNHEDLHFTIQEWDDPPSGGGTKPGDVGHPGTGFGCRCKAEPLT